MAILVDYRCRGCGATGETFVTSPAPTHLPCDSCGGERQRRWSPVGMISRTPEPRTAPARPAPTRPSRAADSLCAQNPDVPGLCHMSPSAGRAWVARYRGDGRALDAELGRQEQAAAIAKPTMADAISHEHSHAGHAH
jgi:hypothetical protein